ncbi:CynX/NimT family MFS transporter [Bacillus sp. 1P06AnD]|uniref:MFS transporter n=1 Tax=Bacillus sp. 1P06AnD TaxID=3132208 RepID=UPI0039A1DB37
MKTHSKSARKEWVMALLLICSTLVCSVAAFGNIPILSTIMDDLSMSLSVGGMSVSIIYLYMGIFGLGYGVLIQKLGGKHVIIVSLFILAIGSLLHFFITNIAIYFISRTLIGLGIGLMMPTVGTYIMAVFSEKTRPIMNAIYGAMPLFGLLAVFGSIVPLYKAFNNSWHSALGIFGIIFFILIIVWWKFGSAITNVESNAVETNEHHLFRKVFKSAEIKSLCILYGLDMWVFSIVSTYLPTYYYKDLGMSLDHANLVSMIFPIAGIIGGIICGFWLSSTGRNKPFLTISQLAKVIGMILVLVPVTWVSLLGVAIIGFGTSSYMAALYTIPMELKDTTPAKVGAAFALINLFGFITAFVSPFVGGKLVETTSFNVTFIGCAIAYFVSYLVVVPMKETGPGPIANRKDSNQTFSN